METTRIKVEGMHCERCVENVTGVLKGLPGVQSATVSLAAEEAVVAFDPGQIGRPALLSAIEDAGFDAA